MVIATMTSIFLNLPTDNNNMFPITGNYCMLPLPHPTAPKHDDAIRAQLFIHGLIATLPETMESLIIAVTQLLIDYT